MSLTPLKVSFSRKVPKKRSWCAQDMGWTLENILEKGHWPNSHPSLNIKSIHSSTTRLKESNWAHGEGSEGSDIPFTVSSHRFWGTLAVSEQISKSIKVHCSYFINHLIWAQCCFTWWRSATFRSRDMSPLNVAFELPIMMYLRKRLTCTQYVLTVES